MNKTYKKIVLGVLLAGLVLGGLGLLLQYGVFQGVNASRTERTNTECLTDERVFDQADVLSGEEEEELRSLIADREQMTGLDIVLLTVREPELDDYYSIRDFAQDYYEEEKFVDCPAGDIGVGAREVGYMFGQYKRLTNSFQGGMITGKGLTFGGSLVRTEATGYGLCYFTAEALKCMRGDSFAGKTVVISGSGNVAIYACEKATQLGGKVVTMSDSNGYVYDPNGIDLAYVKDLKEVRRGRIKEYAETHPSATYVADCSRIWETPCDIALPCATQNEIDKASAETLVKNGCTVVCEGANMPSTPEAIQVYLDNGVLYGPAKATNAGGVATSGLEMSQNSERLSWTFEEVDAKLKGIMEGIFHASYDASKEVGQEGNLMVGANCAGFLKVVSAMLAQGITY